MGSSFLPEQNLATSLPVLHASVIERHLGDMHCQLTEGNDCGTESLDLGSSEELQHIQQHLANGGMGIFLNNPCHTVFGNLSSPFIEILNQPQSRGYRFRYKCEGQSHGGLQAEGSGSKETASKRTYPTIAIRNFTCPRARLRVSLVTADDPVRPHAHELIGKNCSNGQFSQELLAKSDGECTFSFTSLSIQHATRKSIPAILKQRLLDELQSKESHYSQSLPVMPTERQITKATKDADEQAKTMQTNAVRLKFEVDMSDSAGVFHYACALSNIVHDSKSTTANPLKISRIDKQAGSCHGGDEVFLLCSKVQKEDIQIKFYELSDDESESWSDLGKFSATDVHRQYAIVFKTPPYKDRNIQQPVEVFMLLVRPSDFEESEPRRFTYHPHVSDEDGIGSKRRKPSEADWDRKFKPPGSGGQDGSSTDTGGSRESGRTYGGGVSPAGARSNAVGNIAQRLLQTEAASQLLKDSAAFHPATQERTHGNFRGLPTVPPGYSSACLFDHLGASVYQQTAVASVVKTEAIHQHHEPRATDVSTSVQQQQIIDQLQQQQHDLFFGMLLGEDDPVIDESFRLSSDQQLLTDDGHQYSELPLAVVSACEDFGQFAGGSPSPLLPLPGRRREAALPAPLPDWTSRTSSERAAAELAVSSHQEGATAVALDDGEMWPAVEDEEECRPSPDSPGLARLEPNAVALQSYACSGDVRFLVAALHRLAAARNDAGDNSIHLAVIHNQPEVLRNLLSVEKQPLDPDGSAVNRRNDDGQTPLHIAAILGLPRMTDMLLRAGADVGLCDRSCCTAWHLAARSGDVATLRVLSELAKVPSSGGGVNGLNYDGLAALHLAVQGGHLPCVTQLVACGADVDAIDRKSGQAALHFAVERENLAVVGYLVTEASADVNQPRFDGNTALHIACCMGLTAIASLLVAAGADIDCENYEAAADCDECDDECPSPEGAESGGSCEDDDPSAEPVRKHRRGNTPLDLAGDNQQILSVLRSRQPLPALGAACCSADEADAEPNHVVPSTSVMMEGLDSDVRTSLASELSASPLAWARLANAVGLGQLVAQLRGTRSPGSSLLDSYEAFNGTVDDLRTQMMKLNLDKAVAILDGSKPINDGRLDSGVGTSLTHSDNYRLQSWGIQPPPSFY